MNKSQKISQQERLAREFESWQKQYYDDVYSLFEKRDEHRLVIAFNHWEDRFIQFLDGRLPRMVDSYKTRTSQFIPLEYYGGSIENFKLVKSDKVEAFLTQCIVDARKGNLDNYHIAPKKYNRTSRGSPDKDSDRKGKKSTGNTTNIYIGGNVTGSNIVVGDENIVAITKNLFKSAYHAIEESPRDELEKADLVAEVNEIESEIVKGEEANEPFLSRRLRNLKNMAPDIAEVALSALTGPGTAISAIVKKVANKIKEEGKKT